MKEDHLILGERHLLRDLRDREQGLDIDVAEDGNVSEENDAIYVQVTRLTRVGFATHNDATMVPRRTVVALFVTMLLTASCAFVESAAEITVGAPDIPEFQIEVLVQHSQVNKALTESLPADAIALAEAQGWLMKPTATWLELRNTLCQLEKAGWLKSAKLEVTMDKPSTASDHISQVTLELSVVGAPLGKCTRGRLRAVAYLDFAPFSIAQAEQIREQLNTELDDLEDAIIQIRFMFERTELVRQQGGITVGANDRLQHFMLRLGAPNLEDDPETPNDESSFELVPFFLLDTISPETPQRFELDPDAAVTAEVRNQILNPPKRAADMTLRVEAIVELKDELLGATLLNGSGIALKLQPEIVINALRVLSEGL